jgi:hypothetical protein
MRRPTKVLSFRGREHSERSPESITPIRAVTTATARAKTRRPGVMVSGLAGEVGMPDLPAPGNETGECSLRLYKIIRFTRGKWPWNRPIAMELLVPGAPLFSLDPAPGLRIIRGIGRRWRLAGMVPQRAILIPAHPRPALTAQSGRSRCDCARCVAWFTCREKNLVFCDLHHIPTTRASA